MALSTLPRLIDSRHPVYPSGMLDWHKYRLTYRGGDEFRDEYLERFNTREDPQDFALRKKMTPIATFAAAAVDDIRNAIFQRMRDIVRVGGSSAYQNAVNGLDLGVDRDGANMNAFLGMKCLTDLLVMGRVGIYVDNSVIEGETQADEVGARPYLYPYQVEDILSWSAARPEQPSEYQSVLLRDRALNYDQRTRLPTVSYERYRLLWIDHDTGLVNLQFYDTDGNEIDRFGNAGGPQELELTRIPFVMPDIGASIIRNVCSHQIALLNLGSTDVNYALKANFPIYTEQRDMRKVGGHLKQAANPDGTASVGGQSSHDSEARVGVMHGRFYDLNTETPSFINPSSEPLKASLQLQEKLEADIRKLVQLAVVSVASKASAESKSLDNQGLEAGLSYIGLVLQSTEQKIADFWAAYESRRPSQRDVAIVKYPDRYSLKNDADRIAEATDLSKLMFSLPGRTVKKEIAKSIVTGLLSGKAGPDVIDTIHGEIDGSDYLTSDPDTIIQAVEKGLCDDKTGSMALGFDSEVYLQAQKDHVARLARIAAAQSVPGENPGARGLNDQSADPDAAKKEKAAASDPTTDGDRSSNTRGKASGSPVSGA
jgi:hypothetical protein